MNRQKGRTAVLLLSALLCLLLLAALWLSARRAPDAGESAPRLSPLRPAQGDVLRCPSRWQGLLTIREHRGEGTLSDGMRSVTGTIGRIDGRSYFELFDEAGAAENEPLLSLWVELEGDTLRPLIGEEDAWYFGIWLDERDVEPFTLRLEDGTLGLDYFYDDGRETCRIEFRIRPA